MLIGVLAGAGIMVSLMQTLVVPLVPSLPRLLHTTSAGASWVVTATLLTAAVTTPVLGRLGDMFGKRRIMLACAGSVAVGSVVCALSSTLAPVIIGRALQGAGIALIPLGISLMRDVVPGDRLGSGLAFMSSSLGVGGALGLPASAAIAEAFGWHALFWTAAGLAAVFALLIRSVVPESSVQVPGRIDVVGVLGLAAGLAAYLLGVSKGGEWGWGSATTLSMFAIAVVVLLAWGWWELRVQSPVLDLRTSARRPVLFTNLTGVGVGLAMYAMNLLSPQLLQLPEETGYGLHFGLLEAGLWMVPAGLVMMALSQVAARMTAARGAKFSLLTGIGIIAAGNALAQAVLGHAWGVLLFTVSVSAGVAFAYAAMPTLIMQSVDPTQTAAANGLNTLSRSLGTSTASAIIGAVLGQLTVTIGGVGYPSETGVRVTLAIGVGAALLAFAVGSLIPRPLTGGTARSEAHSPREKNRDRGVAR
ncbi:MFS transporter [Amycolatopsis acidicola]|uniref:MFS transporter n=1 Tax=Amycolatopsis acidicola TaxID=2596893 RepID=UPI001FB7BACF|nr:MFS transporter [Amycolatopsis acidicola]